MMNEINNIKVTINTPIQLSLKNFTEYAKIISDLSIRLLFIKSPHEFITSDNPVQLFNIYCLGSKSNGGLGLRSTGLLIFYPISPKTCILLFDSKIYKINSSKKEDIILNSKKDIDLINSLQFIGAEKTYFPPTALTKNITTNYPKNTHQSAAHQKLLQRTTLSTIVHSF